MKQDKELYLDNLGVLCNRTSSNALRTPDDLPNALCSIDWVYLRLRRLFNADDKVGNHMRRNLPVCLNQGREECKQRVESCTRN